LSRLNSQAGSARAFARTVRDVIDWRGQRRNFMHRVSEVEKLPPLLILWGDRDALIPIDQGKAFAAMLDGAVFETFEGCGHYLHNERPAAFAQAVRAFLDDENARSTELHLPPASRKAMSLRDSRANPIRDDCFRGLITGRDAPMEDVAQIHPRRSSHALTVWVKST